MRIHRHGRRPRHDDGHGWGWIVGCVLLVVFLLSLLS
jgi:hypothetical protein